VPPPAPVFSAPDPLPTAPRDTSPPAPATSEPAAATPAVPPAEPRDPTAFVFSTRAEKVTKHVAAIRANPDDASLACWPRDLLRVAPASAARQKGDRPVLLVFYDDTARASRLAAADLWPVVLDVESRVDFVIVDLTPGPGHTLSDDEKKLVRRFYTGYVPTTVVLSSDRVPRLLKSERVEPALVRAACLEAK